MEKLYKEDNWQLIDLRTGKTEIIEIIEIIEDIKGGMIGEINSDL